MKQKDALTILKKGHNVFLTGPPGSGKTHVLQEYISFLHSFNIPVAITASTGIAATHIGGTTIHSWSGLGVRENIDEFDLASMAEKPFLKKHFRNVRVLIIDEVSMLHDYQLDIVDRICRHMKESEKPFGGLQVILSGDFFQLPPVSHDDSARFITHSEVWGDMGLKICYLHEQHRQADKDLEKVLFDIRSGKPSESTRVPLRKRYKQPIKGVDCPTKLYTHNYSVDQINNKMLEDLDSEKEMYIMKSSGNKMLSEILARSCLAPERLKLKIGAVVMFVKNNYEDGYVNGTLGVIESFDDVYPRVRTKAGKVIIALPEDWSIEEDGSVKAKITQVPLRLAWAITVHKSQGMTLDAAEMDLSQSFVPGMGYVALSRLRSMDSLMLHGLNDVALEVSEEVLLFDKELRKLSMKAEKEVKESTKNKKNTDSEKTFIKKNTHIPEVKETTLSKTKKYITKKMNIERISVERGLVPSTVISHIERMLEDGEKIDIKYLKPKGKKYTDISSAFKKVGYLKMAPVFNHLKEKYTFAEIRMVRLFVFDAYLKEKEKVDNFE